MTDPASRVGHRYPGSNVTMQSRLNSPIVDRAATFEVFDRTGEFFWTRTFIQLAQLLWRSRWSEK